MHRWVSSVFQDTQFPLKDTTTFDSAGCSIHKHPPSRSKCSGKISIKRGNAAIFIKEQKTIGGEVRTTGQGEETKPRKTTNNQEFIEGERRN